MLHAQRPGRLRKSIRSLAARFVVRPTLEKAMPLGIEHQVSRPSPPARSGRSCALTLMFVLGWMNRCPKPVCPSQRRPWVSLQGVSASAQKAPRQRAIGDRGRSISTTTDAVRM